MVSEPVSPSSLPHAVQRTPEQCLRFRLDQETTAILPVAQLSEVLRVATGQIIPVPHLDVWVMGVYNWRGEILWMVDLGQLLGLAPWHQHSANPTHQAIVLRSHAGDHEKNQMLGLMVAQVEGMEWCHLEEIQISAAVTSPELTPFLRGYWIKSDGEILVALQGEAILAAVKGDRGLGD